MARRTHCPDGRWIYRWTDKTGDLAEGKLATRAELARQRRRPAPGQEPAGSMWSVRQYVPLYLVADTEPLPPLSPKRQAAWDAARTCQRCGETRRDPWPKDWRHWTPGVWSAKAMCPPCDRVEDEVRWYARANVARAGAVAHARTLLADPALTILLEDLHKDWNRQPSFTAVAVDAAGAVLLHETIQHLPWYQDDTTPRGEGVPIAEVAGKVRPLDGRRFVSWHGWAAGRLGDNMHRGFGEYLALDPERSSRIPVYDETGTVLLDTGVSYGGHLNALAADWRGIPAYKTRYDWHQYESWATPFDGIAELLGIEPDGLVAQAQAMLDILRRIAGDDHPGGRASCPQRPGRGDPCGLPATGADGMCAAHSLTPQGQAS